MDKQLEERMKARLANRVRERKNMSAGRKPDDDGLAPAPAPAPAPEKKAAAPKKKAATKKTTE